MLLAIGAFVLIRWVLLKHLYQSKLAGELVFYRFHYFFEQHNFKLFFQGCDFISSIFVQRTLPNHLFPQYLLNLPLKFYTKGEWLHQWMSYRCFSLDGTTFCLNILWQPAAVCCYLHQWIWSIILIFLDAVLNAKLLNIPCSKICCFIIPWMFHRLILVSFSLLHKISIVRIS